MKNLTVILIMALSCNIMVCAQGNNDKTNVSTGGEYQMKITVNGHELTATIVNNSSAQALKEMLLKGPKTILMRDYGNMEKVGPLGQNLPRNDESITTKPGDIILYQGNSLVIYYDTNSWNFTKLGSINNITQNDLKRILGTGDVSVTLELIP
jgi:hypothetical protein